MKKAMDNNITTLDEIIDAKYGKPGMPDREEWEQGFEAFKLGLMIEQARTQNPGRSVPLRPNGWKRLASEIKLKQQNHINQSFLHGIIIPGAAPFPMLGAHIQNPPPPG